jgi:hypothetical protein
MGRPDPAVFTPEFDLESALDDMSDGFIGH